mgnify:CR=1 FL=1
MKISKAVQIGAAATITAAVAAGGIAIAAGAGGGDSDDPITGDAYDKATAAALAHIGEGTVTDTEVGDEESLYEVEITLPDGSEVDVQLDANFAIVGSEIEDPNEVDDADGDD